MHKLRGQLTAVFLLLVLTHSMGVRIMLHNRYHQVAANHNAAAIQISCDCLDEALTPGTQPQAIALTAPATPFIIIEQQHRVALSSFQKIFHSLRAPPAA